MADPEDFDAYLDSVLIGGREERVVEIAPYDPSWPQRFETERIRIETALAGAAHRIEHVGSTAVPGLGAKPVVDIMVTVFDPEDETYRIPLEDAGFVLRVREPGHRMFRTPEKDVHLHIWKSGSDDEERHLAFRDWLRSNPDDRDAYERLKRSLAGRWTDVNYYAREKGPFIERALQRARNQFAEGNRPARSRFRGFLESPIAQLDHPSGWLAHVVAQRFNRANRAVISLAIDTLNPDPSDAVLDIGFGGGLAIRMLLERMPTGTVAGTDASAEICGRAIRGWDGAIAEQLFAVKQSVAEALPWEDASFDGVISTNSLHCWDDPVRGITEIRRVLKPGALAVVALALRPALGAIVGRDPALDLAKGDTLATFFERAGFTDVRIEHPAIPRRTTVLATGRRP